jgi:hypothetical protein
MCLEITVTKGKAKNQTKTVCNQAKKKAAG